MNHPTTQNEELPTRKERDEILRKNLVVEHTSYLPRLATVLRKIAVLDSSKRETIEGVELTQKCKKAYAFAQAALVTNRGPTLLNNSGAAVQFGESYTSFRIDPNTNVNWVPLKRQGFTAEKLTKDEQNDLQKAAQDKTDIANHFRKIDAIRSKDKNGYKEWRVKRDNEESEEKEENKKNKEGKAEFDMTGTTIYVLGVDDVAKNPIDKYEAIRIGITPAEKNLDDFEKSHNLVSVGKQRSSLQTIGGGSARMMMGRPTKSDLAHTCFADMIENSCDTMKPFEGTSCDLSYEEGDAEKVCVDECLGKTYRACNGTHCPQDTKDGKVCSYIPRYATRVLHQWAIHYQHLMRTWVENNTDQKSQSAKIEFNDWLDSGWCSFLSDRWMMSCKPCFSPDGISWDRSRTTNPRQEGALGMVHMENEFFLDSTVATECKDKKLKANQSTPIPIMTMKDQMLTPRGAILMGNMGTMLQTCLAPGMDAVVTYQMIRWICCWEAPCHHSRGRDITGVTSAIGLVIVNLVKRLQLYADRLRTYCDVLTEEKVEIGALITSVTEYITALKLAQTHAENIEKEVEGKGGLPDAITMRDVIEHDMKQQLGILNTLMRFTADSTTDSHGERLAKAANFMPRHNRDSHALEVYLMRRVMRYVEASCSSTQLRNLREVMTMPHHRDVTECKSAPVTSHAEFEGEADYLHRLFALGAVFQDQLSVLHTAHPEYHFTETEVKQEHDDEEKEKLSAQSGDSMEKDDSPQYNDLISEEVKGEVGRLMGKSLQTLMRISNEKKDSNSNSDSLVEKAQDKPHESVDKQLVPENEEEYLNFWLDSNRVDFLLRDWEKNSNSSYLWNTTTRDNFWLVVEEDRCQAYNRFTKPKHAPRTPAGIKECFVNITPVSVMYASERRLASMLTKTFRMTQPMFQEYDEEKYLKSASTALGQITRVKDTIEKYDVLNTQLKDTLKGGDFTEICKVLGNIVSARVDQRLDEIKGIR
jgi:hypothetical protein